MERDQFTYWAQLVRTYRESPDSKSAAALIEALTPLLHARAARIPGAPPVIGADDIWQQLCLEVLVAARTMALPPNPRWVLHKLVQRAGRVVARSVLRELRRSTDQLDESLTSEDVIGIDEVCPTLQPVSPIELADFELIHKRHVLGLEYGRLSDADGVTEEALRQRVSRARRRLRASISESYQVQQAQK
jgi:DNA-directed RNA polymerase specialized sigma24 family protein